MIKYVFYLYLIWDSKSTTTLKCLWNRPGVRPTKCDGSTWFSTTSTVSTTITTTIHHTWRHIYHIHYTYIFTYFSECYQSTRSIYPLKIRNCEAGPGGCNVPYISENCHVLLTTTEQLALETSVVLSSFPSLFMSWVFSNPYPESSWSPVSVPGRRKTTNS